MKDPSWGKKYRTITKDATKSVTLGRKWVWITYKQMCDKYGKEHADSLIDNKLIPMKQDERNPNIWYFADNTDYMHQQFTRSKGFKAGQHLEDAKGKEDKKEFRKFTKGLSKMRSNDIDLDDADLSDNNDDDDDNGSRLPSSLVKLMGKKEKRRKVLNSGGDPDDQDSDGKSPKQSPSKTSKSETVYQECLASLAGDDKEKMMNKAAKMHTMLMQVVKKTNGATKTVIKATTAAIGDKIADEKSSGMAKLLQKAAKLWKKAKD